MASTSFSTQKRPAGSQFRHGVMGDVLDDIYGDVEAGFAAMELYTPVILRYTRANGATSTVDVAAPFDLTILDAYVVKTTAVAANNDANTVTIKNDAETAVSDDISIRNAAVGAVARAATIRTASADVDKNDNIKITFTRSNAGDNNACIVNIVCIRR